MRNIKVRLGANRLERQRFEDGSAVETRTINGRTIRRPVDLAKLDVSSARLALAAAVREHAA